MRNALVVITAFCVGSALVACNSKTKPTAATPPPAPVAPKPNVHEQVVTLTWSLTFQSKCAAEVEATQCLGAHGFTVSKSGDYKVGPGPQGELRTGKLAPEELQTIETALASTLSQNSLRAEAHDPIEAVTTEDSVTFVKNDAAPELLVKAAGTDFSYRTQNAEEAKSLLNAIRNLATKYYKTPFPDECTDGAAALQNLFSSMQTCSVDADCAYLDSALEVIPSNSTDQLVTDDCSLVRPLTVGNSETVKNNKTKLLESLDTVRGACRENIIRPDCTEVSIVQLSGTAPTCQQGVCKLNTTR